MKYNPETEEYELESGKVLPAFPGGDEGMMLAILDSLPWPLNLTPSERREIADYMIKLWKEWGR